MSQMGPLRTGSLLLSRTVDTPAAERQAKNPTDMSSRASSHLAYPAAHPFLNPALTLDIPQPI